MTKILMQQKLKNTEDYGEGSFNSRVKTHWLYRNQVGYVMEASKSLMVEVSLP